MPLALVGCRGHGRGGRSCDGRAGRSTASTWCRCRTSASSRLRPVASPSGAAAGSSFGPVPRHAAGPPARPPPRPAAPVRTPSRCTSLTQTGDAHQAVVDRGWGQLFAGRPLEDVLNPAHPPVDRAAAPVAPNHLVNDQFELLRSELLRCGGAVDAAERPEGIAEVSQFAIVLAVVVFGVSPERCDQHGDRV